MRNSVTSERRLRDGRYEARCRQATLLSAAAAGHSSVFPVSELVISGGWARFYKEGKEVWSCNPAYAAANFDVVKIA
nr:hypothetical protein [Cupriavidus sp. WS]